MKSPSLPLNIAATRKSPRKIKSKELEKGRRKLDFLRNENENGNRKKPLQAWKVFLDIQMQTKALEIRKRIESLGGRVDDFLSKDVNIVITSQKLIQRPDSVVETLSPIPSVPSSMQPLSNKCSKPYTPRTLLSTDSPQNSIENMRKSRPAPPQSRGKSLLDKVLVSKRGSGTFDVVNKARNVGANLMTVNEFMGKYMKRKGTREPDLSTLKDRKKTTQMLRTSRSRTVSEVEVMKLQNTFFKVEDHSKAYRPIMFEIKQWPKIYFDTHQAQSPFDIPKEKKSEKGKTCDAEVDEETLSIEERSEDKSETQELKAESTLQVTKTVEKSRPVKPGYCDCCSVRYQDLDKHLKSDQHRTFARDSSNFKVLDELINVGTSFGNFLQELRGSFKEDVNVESATNLVENQPSGNMAKPCTVKDEPFDTSLPTNHKNILLSPARVIVSKEDQTSCIDILKSPKSPRLKKMISITPSKIDIKDTVASTTVLEKITTPSKFNIPKACKMDSPVSPCRVVIEKNIVSVTREQRLDNNVIENYSSKLRSSPRKQVNTVKKSNSIYNGNSLLLRKPKSTVQAPCIDETDASTPIQSKPITRNKTSSSPELVSNKKVLHDDKPFDAAETCIDDVTDSKKLANSLHKTIHFEQKVKKRTRRKCSSISQASSQATPSQDELEEIVHASTPIKSKPVTRNRTSISPKCVSNKQVLSDEKSCPVSLPETNIQTCIPCVDDVTDVKKLTNSPHGTIPFEQAVKKRTRRKCSSISQASSQATPSQDELEEVVQASTPTKSKPATRNRTIRSISPKRVSNKQVLSDEKSCSVSLPETNIQTQIPCVDNVTDAKNITNSPHKTITFEQTVKKRTRRKCSSICQASSQATPSQDELEEVVQASTPTKSKPVTRNGTSISPERVSNKQVLNDDKPCSISLPETINQTWIPLENEVFVDGAETCIDDVTDTRNLINSPHKTHKFLSAFEQADDIEKCSPIQRKVKKRTRRKLSSASQASSQATQSQDELEFEEILQQVATTSTKNVKLIDKASEQIQPKLKKQCKQLETSASDMSDCLMSPHRTRRSQHTRLPPITDSTVLPENSLTILTKTEVNDENRNPTFESWKEKDIEDSEVTFNFGSNPELLKPRVFQVNESQVSRDIFQQPQFDEEVAVNTELQNKPMNKIISVETQSVSNSNHVTELESNKCAAKVDLSFVDALSHEHKVAILKELQKSLAFDETPHHTITDDSQMNVNTETDPIVPLDERNTEVREELIQFLKQDDEAQQAQNDQHNDHLKVKSSKCILRTARSSGHLIIPGGNPYVTPQHGVMVDDVFCPDANELEKCFYGFDENGQESYCDPEICEVHNKNQITSEQNGFDFSEDDLIDSSNYISEAMKTSLHADVSLLSTTTIGTEDELAATLLKGSTPKKNKTKKSRIQENHVADGHAAVDDIASRKKKKKKNKKQQQRGLDMTPPPHKSKYRDKANSFGSLNIKEKANSPTVQFPGTLYKLPSDIKKRIITPVENERGRKRSRTSQSSSIVKPPVMSEFDDKNPTNTRSHSDSQTSLHVSKQITPLDSDTHPRFKSSSNQQYQSEIKSSDKFIHSIFANNIPKITIRRTSPRKSTSAHSFNTSRESQASVSAYRNISKKNVKTSTKKSIHKGSKIPYQNPSSNKKDTSKVLTSSFEFDGGDSDVKQVLTSRSKIKKKKCSPFDKPVDQDIYFDNIEVSKTKSIHKRSKTPYQNPSRNKKDISKVLTSSFEFDGGDSDVKQVAPARYKATKKKRSPFDKSAKLLVQDVYDDDDDEIKFVPSKKTKDVRHKY